MSGCTEKYASTFKIQLSWNAKENECFCALLTSSHPDSMHEHDMADWNLYQTTVRNVFN